MRAPHHSSPIELQDRLRAEREGAPFLLYRSAGVQRIVPLPARGDRVTIGRHGANDLALAADAEVSGLHAALERLGSAWTLVDDGLSRNGSFVNASRVAGRCRLHDGDVLRFGQTTVVYNEPQDAQSSFPTRTPGASAPTRQVSPTQRKVLVALCRPLGDPDHITPATNREIADELVLSIDAVKTHLRILYERFGIEGLPQNQKRARLAALALEYAMVVPQDLWG